MNLAAKVAVVLAATALTASAQVVHIENNSASTGTSNTIPWSQAAGYTSLHVYTAAQLQAGGVCPGATLTDFAIAPSSGTSGTYNAPQFRMQVGHLSVNPPVSGAWTTHLATPVTVHDLTSGPYTFPWTINTWTPLPGFATSGFVWDGVRDVGILMTSSAGTTGTFSIRRTATNQRHGVNIFNATNQAPTTTGLFAMKARLTFTPGPALYQVNQPASTLNIDGVTGSACSAAQVDRCVNVLVTANFQSTLAGNGYEVAITAPENLVPAGGGAIATPSGQLLNVNFAAPSLFFLNGLTFPPFPGNFALPFAPPAPLALSAQMAVLNPASPDGLSLSAGVNLDVVSSGTFPGPSGDDVALTLTLAGPPTCGPASFPFYGAAQTQIHVATNGRVTFGAANTTFGPTTIASAQAAPGFVGAWTDLDTTLAGSVTVTSTATSVTVNYNAVEYFGLPGTTNTFQIVLDASNGNITLNGLTGITVPSVAQLMFLGISRGATATDPGAAAFVPMGSGTTLNSTAMLYNLGNAGSLAPGVSTISFIPNGVGNYDFLSN